MKYAIRKIIFFLIVLIPFWSFLVWFFYPKTTINGLMLDKTVLTRQGEEHRSLNWVLSHEKYTKPDGSQYEISEDYYGFFPVNRPEYVVKDLTVFTNKEIDSLARVLDFVHYTDAYGIYQNEWIYGRDINERSAIVYGGLVDEDYQLFEDMFTRRKLTIAEFNNLASPTALNIRFKMSRLLEIDFSGWTGRYYHSLDTLVNEDIPFWMRRLHRRHLGKPFDYPDVPGIVMIHETEKIMVLRSDKHLEYEVPIINTRQKARERYDLPEYLRYPYWFDVSFSLNPENTYATYKIHTTESGDSIFNKYNLPSEFPAMIVDDDEHLRYYFCGDFSDNPIPFGLAYFKGVEYIDNLFFNNRDLLDRKKFFWEYYVPLMQNIFDDFLQVKDTLEPGRRLPPTYSNYASYYSRMGWRLPDIEAIASNRRYDPDEVLGEEFRRQAYLDSVRRREREAIRRERERSGAVDDTAESNRYRVREYNEDEDLDTVRSDKPDDSLNEPATSESEKTDEPVDPDTGGFEYPLDTVDEVKPVSAADYDQEDTAQYFRKSRYYVGGRQPSGKSQSDGSDQESTESKEEEEASAQEREPVKSSSQVSDAREGTFHIIVASLKTRREAENLLKKFNDNQASIIYTPKVNSYRISRGSYASLRDAQRAANELRNRYPDAWIARY